MNTKVRVVKSGKVDLALFNPLNFFFLLVVCQIVSGLVHISQLSSKGRVENVSDVVI